jgi:UDP-MurNAc hydroxylase
MPYLRPYAARRASLLEARARAVAAVDPVAVLGALRHELSRKLDALALRGRVALPLYVTLEELPGRHLRVSFPSHRVEEVVDVPETGRYTLRARAGDVARVLERRVPWEAFLLSFRHRMSRDPDQYDPVLHGFLALEVEDLPAFCDAVLRSESQKERTVIEAGGRRWSIQRFCPHQGADLSAAWVQGSCVVCPRHRWRFDLEDAGRCAENGASVHARTIGGQPAAEPARTVA